MTRNRAIWVVVFTLVFGVGFAFAQDEELFVVVAGGRDWRLSGNAGTTPGTHFLGTTDNQALELRVNGQRALRLEPHATSPNVIGGHSVNSVSAGVYGATICGGGEGPSSGHSVSADYATVGGGFLNTASGYQATVGGGAVNTASDFSATVGGGAGNEATADVATVPGGYFAVASHHGEMAYASGRFANSGDAQTSLYVLRNQTTDDTATELFLDGSFQTQRLTLAGNRVMTFDILVVATEPLWGVGNSAGFQIRGVIKSIGGTTAFVGTPSNTELGKDIATWHAWVQADDTLNALVIKVIGSDGMTIRWVASVRTVEVGR